MASPVDFDIFARFVNLNKVIGRAERDLAKLAATPVKIRIQTVNDLQRQFNKTLGGSRSLQDVLGKPSNNLRTTIGQVNELNKRLDQSASLTETLGRKTGLTLQRFGAYTLAAQLIGNVQTALVGATKASLDFNREFVRLQQLFSNSKFRVSQDQLSGLRGVIDQAASDTGISAQEFAQAAKTFANAGRSISETRTLIQQLAPAGLTATFGDLGKSAEPLEAILGQFNLRASQLTPVLDSLNAVTKEFNVEISEIFRGTRKTGAIFAALDGISDRTPKAANLKSFQELAAIFTTIIKTSRESADVVGTSLKTILARLQRSKVQEQVFGSVGVSLTEGGKFVGNFEALKRLSTALKGADGSIDTTSGKFTRLAESIGAVRQLGRIIPLLSDFGSTEKILGIAIEGTTSVQKDASDALKDFSVQLQRLGQDFNKLIRDIGQTETFRALARIFIETSKAAIALADSIKPLIPLIALVATFQGGKGLIKFGTGVGRSFRQTVAKNRGGRVNFQGGGTSTDVKLTPGEKVFFPNSINRTPGGLSTFLRANTFGTGVSSLPSPDAIVGGTGNSDSVLASIPTGSFVLRKKISEQSGINKLNRGGIAGRRSFVKGGSSFQELKDFGVGVKGVFQQIGSSFKIVGGSISDVLKSAGRGYGLIGKDIVNFSKNASQNLQRSQTFQELKGFSQGVKDTFREGTNAFKSTARDIGNAFSSRSVRPRLGQINAVGQSLANQQFRAGIGNAAQRGQVVGQLQPFAQQLQPTRSQFAPQLQPTRAQFQPQKGPGFFSTIGSRLGANAPISAIVAGGILGSSEDQTTRTAGGVLAGAGTGAFLGSAFGPFGTAIGALAGGLLALKGSVDANTAAQKEQKLQAAISDFTKALNENKPQKAADAIARAIDIPDFSNIVTREIARAPLSAGVGAGGSGGVRFNQQRGQLVNQRGEELLKAERNNTRDQFEQLEKAFKDTISQNTRLQRGKLTEDQLDDELSKAVKEFLKFNKVFALFNDDITNLSQIDTEREQRFQGRAALRATGREQLKEINARLISASVINEANKGLFALIDTLKLANTGLTNLESLSQKFGEALSLAEARFAGNDRVVPRLLETQFGREGSNASFAALRSRTGIGLDNEGLRQLSKASFSERRIRSTRFREALTTRPEGGSSTDPLIDVIPGLASGNAAIQDLIRNNLKGILGADVDLTGANATPQQLDSILTKLADSINPASKAATRFANALNKEEKRVSAAFDSLNTAILSNQKQELQSIRLGDRIADFGDTSPATFGDITQARQRGSRDIEFLSGAATNPRTIVEDIRALREEQRTENLNPQEQQDVTLEIRKLIGALNLGSKETAGLAQVNAKLAEIGKTRQAAKSFIDRIASGDPKEIAAVNQEFKDFGAISSGQIIRGPRFDAALKTAQEAINSGTEGQVQAQFGFGKADAPNRLQQIKNRQAEFFAGDAGSLEFIRQRGQNALQGNAQEQRAIAAGKGILGDQKASLDALRAVNNEDLENRRQLITEQTEQFKNAVGEVFKSNETIVAMNRFSSNLEGGQSIKVEFNATAPIQVNVNNALNPQVKDAIIEAVQVAVAGGVGLGFNAAPGGGI